MPKRKINVLSNYSDQAPKTKNAGYGKVVDSMREEMTEAMNSTNVPNILSDDSNQAPKTRAAGYEENVLKPLQNEINERMDRMLLEWSDLICDYINDFVNKNDDYNRYIAYRVLNLWLWDSITFEIKREKVKYEWLKKTVWYPVFWDFGEFSHNFVYRSKDWPLQKWEISTAIVVKRDENDSKILHVHAKQLENPGRWAMISKGTLYYNPNVSDKDFQEIISNKSDSNGN